jgi:hypothetical protein
LTTILNVATISCKTIVYQLKYKEPGMTHLDGSDVVVMDAQGRHLPSVEEVRLDYDRAVIAVSDVTACLHALKLSLEDDGPACAIRSARDGRLHWCGPVRLALT